MINVPCSFEELLGERERFRSARPASWATIENWLGLELPRDYKELVDGYGDAILLGHLFLPHPEGGDPLLAFMQEERRDFHAAFDGQRSQSGLPDDIWDRLIPWAYHDWNGDLCLLVPPSTDEDWAMAVAFRQCPEIQLIPGSVTGFLHLLLRKGKLPRGWPTGLPTWKSMEETPLI
ncbi:MULTISPECIES: hypothetical protein [unclassified Streptomyces]|uniref:hypothetical protein n=1 Tax=unclassified Streptomyces TaxID=2593676 RepID=UPI002DD91D14|nr:hypothetical protein [Streptomyces sp. NBC_01750]WSB05121.1 SMI1/KNR4 family protein [Streptomyces sp. NBC_01794]WSD30547.1 SMI1/KNR4 family protein [Streptomyces sp. NBC_01750]